MVSTSAGLMVAVKNQPWNHRDMDCYSIKLCSDNERQSHLLLLGKVEEISDYQGPYCSSGNRINDSRGPKGSKNRVVKF